MRDMATVDEQARCFQLVYDTGRRYVNDHCFAERNGRLHLFHIVGPLGKGCYDAGSEVSFGHASSADLRNWQTSEDVLSVDPRSPFERDHIFAPHVAERGGVYFMFYAGIDVASRRESMCLATSGDLSSWAKHPFNPVFRPSRHWAEYAASPGIWGCCRDPHVLAHPRYGYILYYVAWMKGTGGRLVAIGSAVSEDLYTWQDTGPVMVRAMAADGGTASMESPCVVARDGTYYLFYKHRDGTRLVVSDDPFQFTDREDEWFSCAHAAEVFEVAGRWYISSCAREPTDLYHERSDRTKGLYLASLEWQGDRPVIRPFEPLSPSAADSLQLPGPSSFRGPQ